MARFKRAGLAIMALTTLPELGFNANTAAIAYGGSTHNPWDTALSPGGSSGGTAALVAARAVPMGYANDGGGSIRIPAAMNGLVGLKPSRGRISLGPDYGEVVSGLGVEFALMRTMRDCALLLDQVAGSAPGDPSKLQAPERPYVQEVGADPGRLKVAFTTKAYSGVPVDSEVADATVAVAKRLASLGHEVEEASPTYDTEAFHCANVNIWSATVAEGVLAVSDLLNVEPSHDNLEATTFACYEYGKTVSAMQMAEAHSTLNAVSRQLGDFFTRYDLLVTPTLARPPFPLGLLNADDPSLDADGWTRKIFTICPFTCIFNATGQPAISLPLGHTESRLPIGVQLAAPMSEEAMLIRVGSQLEETMPWRDRCPIVHVAA
jgi:amidase